MAITGAAKGVGKATAERLVAEGALVAIGDIDLEAAFRTAAGLGPGAIGLALDVTCAASMAGFLDETEARIGPLDVLVNNAGIMVVGSFADEDDTAAAREVAVNVLGVVHGMRHAIKRMRLHGGPHRQRRVARELVLHAWRSPPTRPPSTPFGA